MIIQERAVSLVKWCKSHDWGFEAYFLNGQIHGLIDHVYNASTQTTSINYISFDSRQAIRDWAGY